MSGLTSELALGTAVGADDTANYLTITLANALNTIDGEFSSATGHNHNGAHQGGALVFGVLNTTSIQFANGATLGPFATGTTLRFQSINVTHSGNLSVDGTATIGGTLTVTGGLVSPTVSGNLSVTGTIAATSTITGTDVITTTGWHRNNTAATGIINTALGIGLRFDTGRAGPIMHGGAYDGARVHGNPHVRVGYFTTPAVVSPGEATVGVTFTPAFPAGASPVCMLTLLRNVADHMPWRIGLEFGQTTNTGFVARVRNEVGNTEAVSVAYLAYWNE